MKRVESYTSQLPSRTYLDRATPEPFVSWHNPSDKPSRELEIPASTRFRHVYVAGASQHGKSTLLEHMIFQDMHNNEGITLLDPKGDLADSVLNRVPSHRVNECVYIHMNDPIPINFMGWETEDDRQTLLSDIIQTFLKFSNMPAGDQWGSILQWTIHTLLASRCASFIDIYYFLAREDRKTAILEAVEANNSDGRYDDIAEYWKNEFPKLGNPRERPILTRMSSFITTPPLRKILGPSSNPLDIFDCMEKKKILLVNLMGAGRANGNMLGTLIASKVQQSAFRRQSQPKSQRVPHYFYADEFQNFQTSDFDTILAEAGGFKLSLTLANQGLYQLDSQIKQAIFTNVTAARIAFNLNPDDVHNWRHYLLNDPEDADYIDPHRLSNLPQHVAFFKIGTQPPVIAPTQPPLPAPTPEQLQQAEAIRVRTLKFHPSLDPYRSKREKRPIPSDTRHSPAVRQNKGNERNDHDEPQASAAGTIPPSHRKDKKGPRNPR